MKESEALKKLCPMRVHDGDCMGSKCMAWEPDHRPEEKTISIGEPIPDDWHFAGHNGTVQNIRKYIPIDSGDCGMKSKENGCFYPG